MKALDYFFVIIGGLIAWTIGGTFVAVAIVAVVAIILAPVAVIVATLGLPAILLYYFL
jgi:hypothetical protein